MRGIATAFIMGSFLGSFFYTLALKFISGEIERDKFHALMGRSKCPTCGSAVAMPFLVPVLGYFFARGRCGKCAVKISPLYPIWEIIYGTICALLFWHYGLSQAFLIVLIMLSVMVCLSLVDFKTMVIPDSLLIVLAVVAVYAVWGKGNFPSHLYGFLMVTGFMFLVMFIFPGSFGGGDLKLMAVCSFYLGLEMSLVFLEVTLVGGALLGVLWVLLRGGGSLKVRIPFAPFITLGFAITELFGGKILLFYYSIMSILP